MVENPTVAPSARACSVLFAALAWGLAPGCAEGPPFAPAADALTLREVLALEPEIVAAWDDGERAWWRHRFDEALDAQSALEVAPAPARAAPLPAAASVGLALPRAWRDVLAIDALRGMAGDDPLLAVRSGPEGDVEALAALSLFEGDGERSALEILLLEARGAGTAGGVGAAGRDDGAEGVRLEAAPSAPFAVLVDAAEERAWVNPVIGALAGEGAAGRRAGGGIAGFAPTAPRALEDPARFDTVAWGDANPYGFYSTIAECAAAEGARCDSCAAGDPDACIDKLRSGDGAAECDVLRATADGFTLACLMYAWSLSTVEFCMQDTAPGCAPLVSVVSLDALESFRPLLDGPGCAVAMDDCLAPYRDGIDCGCGDPCGDACSEIANACTEPCTSGLDACTSTADACGETCSGCGGTASSTGDSCSSACDSSCDSCSVAARRPPPPPASAVRGHVARARRAEALRNGLALLLPPLAILALRRRQRGRPDGGAR